jgi:hypothetical protein
MFVFSEQDFSFFFIWQTYVISLLFILEIIFLGKELVFYFYISIKIFVIIKDSNSFREWLKVNWKF